MLQLLRSMVKIFTVGQNFIRAFLSTNINAMNMNTDIKVRQTTQVVSTSPPYSAHTCIFSSRTWVRRLQPSSLILHLFSSNQHENKSMFVFGDSHISTHINPKHGQHATQIGKCTGHACSSPQINCTPAYTPFWATGVLGEQNYPKWEIPCPGCRWTTVQNLSPLCFSSAEKFCNCTNKQNYKQ